MREFVRGDEYEVASDAASLAQIQVRKPKGSLDLTSRKKAGDITDRLGTLSQQLGETSETAEAPASTFQTAKPEAPGDILDYWMQIRDGRRYPPWTALDPEFIGSNWPNCVLIHINKAVGRLQVKYEFTNAIRKAAQETEPSEAMLHRIEFTPMIIDWILAQSRTVAVNGKPCHDTEYFPSLTGEFPLRVIALPMSDDSRSIDHVLCYLQKMD
ncbi:MAG: hypothetical protein JJ879_15190 [Sneathiella sp.]|nr:hypothetical protein [Sneathiella sp.]